MIDEIERQKMLKAHSIGPKMVGYLEAIGISSLAELKRADAGQLAMRIDIHLGRRHMNRQGIAALQNLIDLAERG